MQTARMRTILSMSIPYACLALCTLHYLPSRVCICDGFLNGRVCLCNAECVWRGQKLMFSPARHMNRQTQAFGCVTPLAARKLTNKTRSE